MNRIWSWICSPRESAPQDESCSFPDRQPVTKITVTHRASFHSFVLNYTNEWISQTPHPYSCLLHNESQFSLDFKRTWTWRLTYFGISLLFSCWVWTLTPTSASFIASMFSHHYLGSSSEACCFSPQLHLFFPSGQFCPLRPSEILVTRVSSIMVALINIFSYSLVVIVYLFCLCNFLNFAKIVVSLMAFMIWFSLSAHGWTWTESFCCHLLAIISMKNCRMGIIRKGGNHNTVISEPFINSQSQLGGKVEITILYFRAFY